MCWSEVHLTGTVDNEVTGWHSWGHTAQETDSWQLVAVAGCGASVLLTPVLTTPPITPPSPPCSRWTLRPFCRRRSTLNGGSEVREAPARPDTGEEAESPLKVGLLVMWIKHGGLQSKCQNCETSNFSLLTFTILEAEHGYASSLPSSNQNQIISNKNQRLKNSTKKAHGSRLVVSSEFCVIVKWFYVAQRCRKI